MTAAPGALESVDRKSAWDPLQPTGLTWEQQAHFAEHGWVVLDSVFTADECASYIAALERAMEPIEHPVDALGYPGRQVQSPIVHDPFFLTWFAVPGLLEAHRQLIGVESIRLNDHKGVTNLPHPDRHAVRAELRDFTQWDWHRDFLPKWGLRRRDDDPRLINSVSVTSATFLTPASPEHGSTAFLDGSHLAEGHVPPLGNGERIHQVTAPAGSVILFSESLWHSTVPVTAEEPRYVIFTWLTAPWLATDPEMQQALLPYADRLADRELRDLFVAPRPLDLTGLPRDG